MTDRPIDALMASLQERAKELHCLYEVDEILADVARPLAETAQRVVDALPAGWQHSEVCAARLRLGDVERATENFRPEPPALAATILVDGAPAGELAVHYVEPRPAAHEGPFLREERKLIDTLAGRIGFYLMRRNLRQTHASLESAQARSRDARTAEWGIILDFLRRTDPGLLGRVTRRLINRLALLGLPEAESLLRTYTSGFETPADPTDENVPAPKLAPRDLVALSEETFRVAGRNLGEDEMVSCIRNWIDEERSSFLIEILEDQSCTLSEIVEAIERHASQIGDTRQLPAPARKSLSASLLRRMFTDEIEYVNVARDHVALEDVYELVRRIVYPIHGHGKLGGKSAGLALAAELLRKADDPRLRDVKVPRAWYVSSDALLEFMSHNNLRELFYRKYLPVEHVRQEYPHIVHVLKNSHFPPEISRGLAVALDEFADRPLIVRSSSLLEDRKGSSFAGKYKSLFLANQGSRSARLAALQDAIAEIYASVFSPDAIEYRGERGLLNVHEEMGILIQEVVGRRIGRYYLPAYSGVAFSHNEFRWSPRIRREDGLLRMVPGLGTRAVDRVGDDYPVLVAPGQPGLRVNTTPEEIARYSPRWMDVIDLESGTLRTIAVDAFLRECGAELPDVRRIVSVVDGDRIRKPVGLEPDFESDRLVVTFQGLVADTPFLERAKAMLEHLRDRLGRPVDLEFAADGDDLYLVQCRTQSHAEEYAPAAIPRNLSPDRVLFTARRGISNGRVPDLTHVVYVDPDRYAELGDLEALRRVGRAVGKLNRLLPKRQFALIGPGRWGSRGDIKLGVRVTYADINNAAVLMEVARPQGGYVPELSFGTHFFQDLVEAEIRYIPLYPDGGGNGGNGGNGNGGGGALDEAFLRGARNMLPDVLPGFDDLADVVRLVDVGREKGGAVLRILMNADLDEAVGTFDRPRAEGGEGAAAPLPRTEDEAAPEAHWRWRLRMVERIAAALDAPRFGVRACYVFGSVKNATAGPDSDIDLLLHVDGDPERRKARERWRDGWSRWLAEINYRRTGRAREGLLHLHFVTDDDVAARRGAAEKIDAGTDPARPLVLGTGPGATS